MLWKVIEVVEVVGLNLHGRNYQVAANERPVNERAHYRLKWNLYVVGMIALFIFC